jgi:hypothetical protein
MKRIIALFVASIFITAGVWAQSVKATVPFGFTVDNTFVPAGTYIISSADHGVIRISDQKHVYHVSAVLPDLGQAAKANVMVFHRYGNQYFLSGIRSETASMYVRLPVWKVEKQARTQIQEAAVPFSSDVIVALD